MRSSIKGLLRKAIAANITAEMDAGLADIQVVSGFAGTSLQQNHFRVTTSTASPLTTGEVNMGRWEVTVTVSAVTEIDDKTADEHDDMAGFVEAYCLQGNKTLSAALTDSALVVDNVIMGQAQELAVEPMRYSSQEITCECYIKS